MEISDSIKKGLEIVQVSRMDEVLARAMPEFTWDKRIVWRGARSIMNTNHALIIYVEREETIRRAIEEVIDDCKAGHKPAECQFR